jgi:Holliday junction resolvase
MTNKKLGNDFEAQFCEDLFCHGYWVHNMAQNASGQPADVIAVKDGKSYLIDCKVCTGKGFALSRMEENQDLSMELWQACGNGVGWFAILVGERVFMLTHTTIKSLQFIKSTLSTSDIIAHGTPFDKWVRTR